jgi:hypothetical protein
MASVIYTPSGLVAKDVISMGKVSNDSTDNDSEEWKRPWELGVMGGLLFSTVEGDLTETHTYIPDFHAGVFGNVELFYPLGLRVEMYYVGLGTGFVSLGDSKLHFNYLTVPAMFTYQFRPLFQLEVGPYIGVLLNAKDQGDDFKEDITDLVNWLDVGVKIGIRYELSQVVDIGVYFNRGFINTQRGDRVSQFKQYNQCIMFTTCVSITEMLNK